MNWKAMIRDLLEANLTQREIAERIGVTQASVSQVLSGKAGAQRGFRFEPGQRLVDLHASVCGRTPDPSSTDASDDTQPPAGAPDNKESV
ncbi:helix-turn-helix domain-containing protein [Burkholderia vietnamiensis]|uniref:helix-turn-helix domain-containing protein n=1 Tax=Burkholderia vietnamiensis TaxID=60552 RepID=UPI001BA72F02|nr:helix-turn-helix domain-containing protein [Burkholderia vietnamiensis]